MADGDKQARPFRQSGTADVLVVGGGIMGLWAAVHAVRAELSVLLVDQGAIGSGASGGLLGALMPHTPDRWNPKKQLQFDALLSLEREIAVLEAETGLSAGYRRTGRLIPLPKSHLRDIALGHRDDALNHWRGEGRQFHWNVRDAGFASGLVAETFAPWGLVEDRFAARVSPRGLIALLKAWLARHRHVTLIEGAGVARLDPVTQTAVMSDGSTCAFGQAVIANGHQSRHLIESLAGPLAKPVVVPVKGQAALLAADLGLSAPIVYLDGLYVVPHEGGQVAIGSTSENRFDAPFRTDGQLDALIARARQLVPALTAAPVVERWAGLRPKAIGRDPMVGRLPGHGSISVLTGGFKVSFGIAHQLAGQLIGTIAAGRAETGLPDSFSPRAHLSEAGRSP